MVKHIHVPIPNQRSEFATSHVIKEGAVRTALTLMIGRPRNSVEFARRGLTGRRLTPKEIASEAAKMGLPVSGPSERERRAPTNAQPMRSRTPVGTS